MLIYYKENIMFESAMIENLYNKIKTYETLSKQYSNITNILFFIGFVTLGSAFITEAILRSSVKFNFYFMMILYFIGTLFILSGLDHSHKKMYVPYFYKKFSKKLDLDKVCQTLLSDLSNSKNQLELINFFNNLNIDNRYLQLQFATKNYDNAISALSIMLTNKINADELVKKGMQEHEIINAYLEQLKSTTKPALTLVK